MMVNTADITGTRTAGVSEHTYSFLAPRPGEWGRLPVFSSRRTFQLPRAALENKSQGKQPGLQTPGSDGVASIAGTAESPCPLRGVRGCQMRAGAKCVRFPSHKAIFI